MSAVPAYEIRCDCAGCRAGPDSAYLEGHGCTRALVDYGTASEVRTLARRRGGWRTGQHGGKDQCDDCKAFTPPSWR